MSVTHEPSGSLNSPAAPASTAPAILSEPLVDDVRLAEALGYQRPVNIRKLIGRHKDVLEALGGLLHHGVNPKPGGGRPITAYRLNKAQASFVAAKSKTKLADSFTVFMAETFAMVADGRLVAADEEAAHDLQAAAEREAARRRAVHDENSEARSDAPRIVNRGRTRRRKTIARH